MSLTELRISNFKPFERMQKMRLAPITLIFGPNSGGKSSLVQSLMLVKQSLVASPAKAELVPRGTLADLGSFEALVNRHDEDKKLEFGVSFKGEDNETGPSIDLVYGLGERRKGALATAELLNAVYRNRTSEVGAFELGLERCVQERTADKVDEGFLSVHFQPADRSSFGQWLQLARAWLEHEVREAAHAELQGRRRRSLNRRVQAAELLQLLEVRSAQFEEAFRHLRLEVDGGLPTSLTFDDDYRERMRNGDGEVVDDYERVRTTFRGVVAQIWDISRHVDRTLAGMTYLGPVRSHPRRFYTTSGELMDTVGVQGEHTPHVLLREGRGFQQKINGWFERFGIPYKLSLESIGNPVVGSLFGLTLTDGRTRVKVGPSDVGFGIGQLLPVLVEGLLDAPGVICVEQPEIHLHPRLQGELADFLIETAGVERAAVRRRTVDAKQWIVETHSEALIRRLQRRVRERTLHKEDLSVLYVEPLAHGSCVRELRLDDDGGFIDSWPDGFFDERFDEMFGGRA